MKFLIALSIMATIITTGCKNNSQDPQADPKVVAEAIFNAARSSDYTDLSSLIDTDADEDSKRIALAASDTATAREFRQYFSKGKVNGEPVINGDKASVNILFGPDGKKEETFEMVKKEGKWYLQSF